MSTLENDSEHGGVTDEQLEQFFADNPNLRPLPSSQEMPEPEPEPEPEPSVAPVEAPGEGEPETAPEPAIPEPSPETADFLEIDGTQYPRSQIEAAAQFQRQLVNDPQLQRLITDYLTGATVQPQPEPQPQPTGPPEDLDMDDPQMRAIYTLIQQQSEQINQLSQGLRVTHDQSVASQKQQVDSQWRVASTAFGKDHGLDDQEVDHLGSIAARLNVLPSLMQGIDPVTGAPSSPDPIRAFQRALEIAMYQVPEYRDREFRRSVTTMQEEAQKRKLLGAVGGSSGSVARTTTPPKPGSPESRKALLAEVGAMLEGSWSDPTAN